KAFSADEALEQHLIEYIAKDEHDLLQQIDGKTITRFDGSKTVLHVAGKPVQLYEMSFRQQLFSLLMDPNIALLLLIIGAFGLYFEFNHPGVIAPGVFGFIAVLLALFALHFLPIRYGALAMILGAFVLFALEAKLQSHGVLTAGAIVMMILGM